MINLKSIKIQLAFFLTGFALYLALVERDPAFLLSLGMAVICAVAAESLIIYFKEKKLSVSESSIVSGLIIGFLLASDQPIWIFALTALSAIGSKYLFRIKGRHLFNPAGFGVFLATTLLGAQMQWRGTFIWYILVPVSLYFIAKIKKLEVVAGYFLASLLLFGTQALLNHIPLWKVFGYFSYFYIFIMVIEPKTTPVPMLGKLIFGLGTAGTIFILTQAGVRFDAELCSLLLLNLTVPWLNRWTRLNPKGGNA